MRPNKTDLDKRRLQILTLIEHGISSNELYTKMGAIRNDMDRSLDCIRKRGVVIIKLKQAHGKGGYYTLVTPLAEAIDKLQFGDTKMSIQTATKYEPRKDDDSRGIRHSDKPWFIIC